jgi:hypothetical protein
MIAMAECIKGDKRSKVVGVTATPAEHRAWAEAAKADGRSLSSWISRRCNGDPTTAPVRS